jgi:hypothetical protein
VIPLSNIICIILRAPYVICWEKAARISARLNLVSKARLLSPDSGNWLREE